MIISNPAVIINNQAVIISNQAVVTSSPAVATNRPAVITNHEVNQLAQQEDGKEGHLVGNQKDNQTIHGPELQEYHEGIHSGEE